MPEFFECVGGGARIIVAGLAWIGFAIALVICSPFFLLGWLGYRLGWID